MLYITNSGAFSYEIRHGATTLRTGYRATAPLFPLLLPGKGFRCWWPVLISGLRLDLVTASKHLCISLRIHQHRSSRNFFFNLDVTEKGVFAKQLAAAMLVLVFPSCHVDKTYVSPCDTRSSQARAHLDVAPLVVSQLAALPKAKCFIYIEVSWGYRQADGNLSKFYSDLSSR